MEAHATWLIDVDELRQLLSVAASGPGHWNRDSMRELVAHAYASSSESTKNYLSLIGRAQDDEEARLSAFQSADSDLPIWFLVVMAPDLKPAAAIGGRSIPG